MSGLNGRKVNYVSLHDVIFIPGTIGQIGPTLTADANGKTKDLEMHLFDSYLQIKIKGVTAVVPLATVKVARLIDEPVAKKTSVDEKVR